jgi:hypothetical protein
MKINDCALSDILQNELKIHPYYLSKIHCYANPQIYKSILEHFNQKRRTKRIKVSERMERTYCKLFHENHVKMLHPMLCILSREMRNDGGK